VTQISCRALLFDLDGVLVDSTPAVERVWTKWALKRGFDPEETVRRAHGRPSLTTIRELLPDADYEKENREVERSEIEDVAGVVAAPGALALLKSLPPSQWTIVTSCTRTLAEVRIRAAGLPVPEKFITSTDIKNGKPHPEPYLKGAALLGFSPGECVVFEDAPAGIRAGKAAGARVIGILAISPVSELLEAGATWTVKNCGSVSLNTSVNTDGKLILELVETK
jgi:sugar-phosphatase